MEPASGLDTSRAGPIGTIVRTAAGLAAAASLRWRFANEEERGLVMDKILVVGSSGNVGRALVEELTRRGEQVRAGTRNPSQMKSSPGIEPVRFEYAEPEERGTRGRRGRSCFPESAS